MQIFRLTAWLLPLALVSLAVHGHEDEAAATEEHCPVCAVSGSDAVAVAPASTPAPALTPLERVTLAPERIIEAILIRLEPRAPPLPI